MSDGYPTYETALKEAGATVHAYKTFGSYQGDWLALVTFDGRTGWIHDYYGSCSGCDALESDLGYRDPKPGQLAAFGAKYLENIITQEQAEAISSKNVEWGTSADEMLAFVREHAAFVSNPPTGENAGPKSLATARHFRLCGDPGRM